jgi:hypothetical protein
MVTKPAAACREAEAGAQGKDDQSSAEHGVSFDAMMRERL